MGEPVTLDMSTAQPIQAPPVTLDMSTAQPITPQPGFLKRLGQSLGVPTSEEEFKKAISPVKIGPIPIAPGGSGLKAIVDYGTNLYEKAKTFLEKPSLSTAGQAAFATTPAGGTQQNIAEDAATGNYRGAAGGATGLAIQAALPEASKHAAPALGSLADTVEAIADHPITRAMRKTVDVATFERLGKIYDAWANQMPAQMKARAEAMKPVFPGAPLPENPGVFPGAQFPEHPGVFPGAPLPATPAPEQLNPSLVSPARTLPGMNSPEVIRPPAQPIPPRQGLQLTGEVAPGEAEAAQPTIPQRMRTAPDGSTIPRTLSGEGALLEALPRNKSDLMAIAKSRGLSTSRESQLVPGAANKLLINKILNDFSPDELSEIRDAYLENTRMGHHDFGDLAQTLQDQGMDKEAAVERAQEAWNVMKKQTYFPDLKIPAAELKRAQATLAATKPSTVPTVAAKSASPPAIDDDLTGILQESLRRVQQTRANQ